MLGQDAGIGLAGMRGKGVFQDIDQSVVIGIGMLELVMGGIQRREIHVNPVGIGGILVLGDAVGNKSTDAGHFRSLITAELASEVGAVVSPGQRIDGGIGGVGRDEGEILEAIGQHTGQAQRVVGILDVGLIVSPEGTANQDFAIGLNVEAFHATVFGAHFRIKG